MCTTVVPISTLNRHNLASLQASIEAVRTYQNLPEATQFSNLSRLAEGRSCYISNFPTNSTSLYQYYLNGYNATANLTLFESDAQTTQSRIQFIQQFGIQYHFFSTANIPCPVVTSVQELYSNQTYAGAVYNSWITDPYASAVLMGDFTAYGLGIYNGANGAPQWTGIFVTVEDYSSINSSYCG